MSDPYVTSAKITNGRITLSVRVDDFKAGDYVEISGQATQTNGAFANFYDIQQVPTKPNVLANAPNNPDADDKDHFYIYVTGAPSPHQFSNSHDVSAVVRAGRVWLTVLKGQALSGGIGTTAGEGTTWIKKTFSQINGASW